MRRNTFHHLSATVGTNGTLTLPLCDSNTAGPPMMVVGPGYRRNNIRYYTSMPNIEEADRLPAPLGYDKRTVSFQPTMIILDGPLSANYTVEFVRITAGGERGKLAKRPLHRWTPLNDTSIYPAQTIQILSLKPGDTIEFEGVSYWTREQNGGRTPKKNRFKLPTMNQHPPQVPTKQVVHLQIVVKMSWLPQRKNTGMRIVHGSPLDWPRAPSPLQAHLQTPEE